MYCVTNYMDKVDFGHYIAWGMDEKIHNRPSFPLPLVCFQPVTTSSYFCLNRNFKFHGCSHFF